MRRLVLLTMSALGAFAVGWASLGGVGYFLYAKSRFDAVRP